MPPEAATESGSTRTEPAPGFGSRSLPRVIRYWLPVLLYVALIFWVSSLPGIRLPGGGSGLDKFAHAAEYGVLCFLLVRALKESGLVASLGVASAVALVIGLCVGLADELFQSMIPGRESDPADYAADAAGLILAIFLYAIYRRERRGRR